MKFKYKVLENDGMSVKPFSLSTIEANSKEEAYDFLDETMPLSNVGGYWVMTEEEFKQLKELLKKEEFN